jgi:hypothetical protein
MRALAQAGFVNKDDRPSFGGSVFLTGAIASVSSTGCGFVPLASLAGGTLTTPSHGTQQLPDAGLPKANAKLPFDESAHPAQRPESGRIALHVRPGFQRANHLLQLSGREL